MKECSKCKRILKLAEFYKNKSRKDNLANQCKTCRNEYRKQYMKTRSGKDSRNKTRRKNRQRHKWGLSKVEYNTLKEQSNGVCAICGCPETSKDWQTGTVRRLAVDHCHKSKHIRGLLCGNCNRGLGMFEDNIDVLASAISYLINSGIKSDKKETA